MKKLTLISVAALMLAVLFTSCEKNDSFEKDLTGTWNNTITFNNGMVFDNVLDIFQYENGSVTGNVYGTNPIHGNGIDDQVMITYKIQSGVSLQFIGTFVNENTISGNFYADGALLGTWFAVRTK
jgi:hypothetical protein